MLQYLQNVMKLQLAGYQWFFLHQGDYCKHLVLELCAMVMWTSSGGSVRVIFADASWSIVGNSGNSILNSFPIIASLLFEMYLSQTQTLTTQTFVTSESRKILVGLWTWKTSPSPVLNGGAWGGPKFLKASGMQHTMPGAKTPNKGWW